MTEPQPSQEDDTAASARKSINHHFQREARWMVWLQIGLPLVLLLLAGVLGPVLLNALHR